MLGAISVAIAAKHESCHARQGASRQEALTIPMSRLAGGLEKLCAATIPSRSILFFGFRGCFQSSSALPGFYLRERISHVLTKSPALASSVNFEGSAPAGRCSNHGWYFHYLPSRKLPISSRPRFSGQGIFVYPLGPGEKRALTRVMLSGSHNLLCSPLRAHKPSQRLGRRRCCLPHSHFRLMHPTVDFTNLRFSLSTDTVAHPLPGQLETSLCLPIKCSVRSIVSKVLAPAAFPFLALAC